MSRLNPTKYALIVLLLCMNMLVSGQNSNYASINSERIIKNSISIDFGQPIDLKNYPPRLMSASSIGYSSQSHEYEYLIGLGYQRQIKPSRYFRIGLSFGQSKRFSKASFEPVIQDDVLLISSDFRDDKISQMQINLGLTESFFVNAWFSLHLGAEATGVLLLNHNAYAGFRRESRSLDGTSLGYHDEYGKFSSKGAFAMGLSPIIEPNFNLSKFPNVSVALQVKTFLVGKVNFLSTHYEYGTIIKYQNSSTNEYVDMHNIDAEINENTRGLAFYFTELMPFVTLRYRL